MASPAPLKTPLTEVLGIRHPVVQGAMAMTSGPILAAAVSNAGGLGTVTSYTSTPEQLQNLINICKSHLKDPKTPFGVNVPMIKASTSARKTNKDYTGGKKNELVDVVCKSGAKLFVSAAGLPDPEHVEKLHKYGILVAITAGHPKHAKKALDLGVDIIAAQGTEAGGHTGGIGTVVLLPSILDIAKDYYPPMLKGRPAIVVAAGGIVDGRGLASALIQGAGGAWIGTRFIASEEATTPASHKQAVVECPVEGTQITVVCTGRPLRVRSNWYVKEWEKDRWGEIAQLCAEGVPPMKKDQKEGRETEMPFLMGMGAGLVKDVKPAKDIVEEIVEQAAALLQNGHTFITKLKL